MLFRISAFRSPFFLIVALRWLKKAWHKSQTCSRSLIAKYQLAQRPGPGPRVISWRKMRIIPWLGMQAQGPCLVYIPGLDLTFMPWGMAHTRAPDSVSLCAPDVHHEVRSNLQLCKVQFPGTHRNPTGSRADKHLRPTYQSRPPHANCQRKAWPAGSSYSAAHLHIP